MKGPSYQRKRGTSWSNGALFLRAVCLFQLFIIAALILVPRARQDVGSAYDSVALAYDIELGRKADPEGMKHWLKALLSGATTEGKMRESLAGSPEGKAYRERVDRGERFRLQPIEADEFVRAAYVDLLGRPPDPVGRYSYTLSLVEGRMSVEGMLEELGESGEAKQKAAGGVAGVMEDVGEGLFDWVSEPQRFGDRVHMLEHILKSPENIAAHIKANFLCSLPNDGRCGHDNDWFRRFERAGIHVLPVHFYSVIPHVTQMKRESFQRPAIDDGARNACEADPLSDACPMVKLTGFDYNMKRQLEVVEKCSSFKSELEAIPSEAQEVGGKEVFHSRWVCTQHTKGLDQGKTCPPWGAIDAEIYHCMIRGVGGGGQELEVPKKVIEIGSGHSTYIAAEALRESKGELVSIEPYPSGALRKGFEGIRFKLIEQDLQKVDLTPSRFLHILHTIGAEVTKLLTND